MLFEKFNESCKVHVHLWYLGGIGEAFLSLFQRDPSKQLSAHDNMVWRQMLFIKFKMAIQWMANFDI